MFFSLIGTIEKESELGSIERQNKNTTRKKTVFLLTELYVTLKALSSLNCLVFQTGKHFYSCARGTRTS